MTIVFRHFPYLVQQQVMDQMDFIDIFSISSISKKGQILARSYFNRHKFDLFYLMDQERFEIFKDFQLKDYCFYSNTIASRVTKDGFEVFNPWIPKEPDFVPLTIPFSNSEDEPIQKMLKGAEWVTKDHVINLFLSCKKVILGGTHYTDQEQTEICEKWLAAPETQYLEVQSTETFSEDIGKLPEALPVRQLTVPDYWGRKESKIFGSRQCYKVEKADGTPAVVYRDRFFYGIYFRTDFEDAVIGEGV